jgi:hypothetical protein
MILAPLSFGRYCRAQSIISNIALIANELPLKSFEYDNEQPTGTLVKADTRVIFANAPFPAGGRNSADRPISHTSSAQKVQIAHRNLYVIKSVFA